MLIRLPSGREGGTIVMEKVLWPGRIESIVFKSLPQFRDKGGEDVEMPLVLGLRSGLKQEGEKGHLYN